MKSYSVYITLAIFLFSLISCQQEKQERHVSIDLSQKEYVKLPISSTNAPKAIGPYSQAILSGNTLYSSGQIGINPATDSLVDGGTSGEMEQIMKNHKAILAEAGMNFSHVVKCTIFMTDISDYSSINNIYSEYFSDTKPSREALAVAALPGGAKVEVSLIAVKPN